MITLVDVNYYSHNSFTKPEQVWTKHSLTNRYAELLIGKLEVKFVNHAGFTGAYAQNGIDYHFFKGINKFWYPALSANNLIGKQRADVIMVQGLGFPLQTVALRLFCGWHCKIVVQHHGEQPLSGIKLLCQKLASRFVDGYIFTSAGNALSWKKKGVINHRHTLFEVLEASTDFAALNKEESRVHLQLPAHCKLFLWVGRLNSNKNPAGVLNAFSKYVAKYPEARLYMIYQDDDLLPEITDLISDDDALRNSVNLIGRVPHNVLQEWFSACDYYLSGSYKEGSGYALLEAMACGCIPIVTCIPPFKKITNNGGYGYLYNSGDSADLYKLLCDLHNDRSKITRDDVISHFKDVLTFEQIAMDIYGVCKQLNAV